MPNWFDMELPEGFCQDPQDFGSTDERMPDNTQARYAGVMNAQGITLCFLYSNNKVLRFDTGIRTQEYIFPSLDEAKNYIVTMCALNLWEAP